jgi:hypothetical protein
MATVAAWAQSVAATYTTDLNGHRVPDSLVTTSAKGEVTEVRQSINGRQVPMQKTETRVVSDTPAGRVTETIVRRYDQEGNLAATERTVSNEQKRADGGSTVHATIYRSDLNGTLQEAERRVVETQKQGTVTTSDVSLARAGLSGSFETFEKRKVVTTTAPGKVSEDETVYRPNNGQFIEAVRRTREERKENGNDVSVATTYLPDYSGRMAFLRQDVATTKKAPDGSQVTELNIFAPTVDGLVAENGAGPKLKEQQLIMRQPAGTGVVKESVSVRRPSLSDPTHLGTPQTISETLCSGKCLTEPPAAR